MLKKLIKNWLFSEESNSKLGVTTASVKPDDNLYDLNVTHLYMFPAIGGRIIEFRNYDHTKDRNYISRYIIKDDDEFADKLSKIITMEDLKR